MATRGIRAEGMARLLLLFALGLPLAVLGFYRMRPSQSVEIHARMPESGGWEPGHLTVPAGQSLHLRLTSDDVVHGFAIGQSGWPAVDVLPGQVTETTLVFDRPGTYTYYCTRWCGPNHWRMRGTIEVVEEEATAVAPAPLYVTLGIDIDAPHDTAVTLPHPPSASRGAALDASLPPATHTRDVYVSQSPFAVWQALRQDSLTEGLSDMDVWDLVALIWQSQTTPEALQTGQKLYADNCAACHGQTGTGDGVMANPPAREEQPVTDFTDAGQMLGASSALLHGKITRGGMGTSMPYWGPIFTDAQIWALVDYLWTFQFSDNLDEE